MSIMRVVALLVSVVLLAACGGGGSDSRTGVSASTFTDANGNPINIIVIRD